MADFEIGLSVPSRNVFDALLEWNESLERDDVSVHGLVEYIHSVEGVLLDFDDPDYLDSVSKILWRWLRMVRETEAADPGGGKGLQPRPPLVVRALLHTALVRILAGGRDVALPASKNVEDVQIEEVDGDLARTTDEVDRLNSMIEGLEQQHDIAEWERTRTIESGVAELTAKVAKLQADILSARQRQDALAAERTRLVAERISLIQRRYESIRTDPGVVWPDDEVVDALVDTFLYSKTHSEPLTDVLLAGDFAPHVRPVGRAGGQTGDRDDQSRTGGDTKAAQPVSWGVTVRFLGTGRRAAAFGKLVWALGECFDAIPGVTAEVESVGVGSFWVKLRLRIKNVWARDEVIEVLDRTRDALTAPADGGPAKTAAGAAAAPPPPPDHADDMRRQDLRRATLENDDRALDIERKRIENSLLKIEAYQRFSQVIRDSIAQADPVQIDVNELLYMLYKDGKATVGASLEQIADAEKKNEV